MRILWAGTFNLGTGRGTSLNQLAAMVIDRLAPGQVARHAPAQAGELRYSIARIDAARRAFGFAPQRSLERNLDDVIEAVKAVS